MEVYIYFLISACITCIITYITSSLVKETCPNEGNCREPGSTYSSISCISSSLTFILFIIGIIGGMATITQKI